MLLGVSVLLVGCCCGGAGYCWLTMDEAIELAIELRLLSKLYMSCCALFAAGGGVA